MSDLKTLEIRYEDYSTQRVITKFMKDRRMEDLKALDIQYEDYLTQHINNVQKGYHWFKENYPAVIDDILKNEKISEAYLDSQFNNHDKSKYSEIEWGPYRDYFYGDKDKKAFDIAWLHHQHENPHHWQHWVLVNDDEGTVGLDIPYNYLLEMVCDWWAFSWKESRLDEIFSWYDDHKDTIIMNNNSRNYLQQLLDLIKKKL